MNRSLAFVGAVALLAGQPSLALAHPISATLPRAPVSTPHSLAHAGPSNPDGFKVPLAPEMQLKGLSQSPRFAPPARFYPQSVLPLHRWYGWQWTPRYLLFPGFSGTPCYAANSLASSANGQQPFDVTLGSLVDGKANLLAPSTYNRSAFVEQDDPIADDSWKPYSLNAGFGTACGAWSFPSL